MWSSATSPATEAEDRISQTMSQPILHRRFTVDDFYKMSEAGILSQDDRVELIEGEIVEMTPIGSRHAAVVNRLNRLLRLLPSDRFLISVQNPIRLDLYCEPQPDVAVLQYREDHYAAGHPGPGDVVLLIEISESSQAYDRQVKIPLYAQSAIPEVWLVDLEAETITTYADPARGSYQKLQQFKQGDTVTSQGVALKVDDILGPPARTG